MYRANCWDCNDFYIWKMKCRLRDRKTEHFKALTTNCHESAIADHVFSTNQWDHSEIMVTGRSDMHCKIKESLLICDLKPALNENVIRLMFFATLSGKNTDSALPLLNILEMLMVANVYHLHALKFIHA